MGRSLATFSSPCAMEPEASTSAIPFDPECHTWAQKPFDHTAEGDSIIFEAFLPLKQSEEVDQEMNVMTRDINTILSQHANAIPMPLDLCPTSPDPFPSLRSPDIGSEVEDEPEISPSPSSGVFHAHTLDIPLELPPPSSRNRRSSASPSSHPTTITTTMIPSSMSPIEILQEAERTAEAALERNQTILNMLRNLDTRVTRRREEQLQRSTGQEINY